MLKTGRLVLRAWHERHRASFAALHADPDATADLGGPLARAASDDKFDRYRDAFARTGLARWAVEDAGGAFSGYAGVMLRPDPAHSLGPHAEIGWRFMRAAWGRGYATESARAALRHAQQALGGCEVVAYTHAENARSRAVMERPRFRRDPSRDFTAVYDGVGAWRGLVWAAPARTV